MSNVAERAAFPDFTERAHGSKPPTAAELDDVFARAYGEGYEKGREDGYAAGLGEVHAAAERLNLLTQSLATPLSAADEAAVEQLRLLALEIGEQLARHTLAVSPEALAGLVRGALDALRDMDGPAHIALHPQDRAALPEAFSLPDHVNWHDDPALERGDIRAWRDAAAIDGRMKSRITELADAWLAEGAA
ncbi:MAG: FliH/SctL family protein [Algiphilus sp.]